MSKPLPSEDLAHILTHARSSFLTLRNARLFITGGTGFFGHWLLESLLHADRELSLGVHATVLTRNAAAFRAKSPHIAGQPAITLLEGDIRTFAFPAEPHTHILHAATDSAGQQSSRTPEDLYADILAGTRRVLDFAHLTGAHRLLYTSTGAVYGRSTTLLHTPETFPPPDLPPHSYEFAKRAAELMILNEYPEPSASGIATPQLRYPEPSASGIVTPQLRYPEPSASGIVTPQLRYPEPSASGIVTQKHGYPEPSASGIVTQEHGYPEPSGSGLIGSQEEGALAPRYASAVIARCFAFVGPHLPLDAHFAIGNFLGSALANQPIHIRGDGSPRRSWLYMADLAIWLWTLVTHGTPGRAYNVGSDIGMTIAEAAHLTSSTLNPTLPIKIDGTRNPQAPLNSYVPDITRARTELDLRVTIPLDEALRRTAAWHTQ